MFWLAACNRWSSVVVAASGRFTPACSDLRSLLTSSRDATDRTFVDLPLLALDLPDALGLAV